MFGILLIIGIFSFVFIVMFLDTPDTINPEEYKRELEENSIERSDKRIAKIELSARDTYKMSEKSVNDIAPLVKATYVSDELMNAIVGKMSEMVEIKGQMDTILEDIKKGGISL